MKKLFIFIFLIFIGSNISFAKNLPTLKCIIENPDRSKTMQVYDLQEIEKNDPTNNLKSNEFQSFSKKDGEWISLNIFDDVYRIRYSWITNGLEAAHHITINRKTGVFESFILQKHSVHISFEDSIKLISDAPRYNGICERKVNKKL